MTRKVGKLRLADLFYASFFFFNLFAVTDFPKLYYARKPKRFGKESFNLMDTDCKGLFGV